VALLVGAALARQGSRVSAAASDFGQWAFVGPSNLVGTNETAVNAHSGRVTSIAVDPADPNHWLVGAAMGGVWDTADAGATWQPRTDGQPSLAIGAIAFSPTSPNVVYAGTGEANHVSFSYAGAGMMRSDDSGVTWSVVSTATFARASVKAIAVHPADPNIVLAATARGTAGRDGGRVIAPPVFGVQRSTDGGRTWTRLLTGQVSALVPHPDNFSRQYAAIGDPYGIPDSTAMGDFQPGTMPNGLYRTTDTGDHWTPVAGPWTSAAGRTAYGSGYIALAVAPSNPDVMYASVQLPFVPGVGIGELFGLFRTNNAWAATPEWIRIPTDAARYCGGNKCQYSHVISVDPSDSNSVFAGGMDLWRCQTCAASPAWSHVNTNGRAGSVPVHEDYHAMTWVGNCLIVATDGGVYSSLDRSANWRSHNTGLPLVQFFSGAVHPTRSDLIVGNTQDNGLDKWTGSGVWERLTISAAFGEGEVAISSSHPDTDWAMAHVRRVARTVDGGRSFQYVDAGLDLTDQGFPFPLRKCPGNDDVVFVGTTRLWRTNDFFSAPAPTWFVNGQSDPSSCGLASCRYIRAVAFSNSDTSCNAYAYGTGGGVLRITANGGSSWSDFDPLDGVPNRGVTAIAFAPSDGNVAYVTISSFDEGTPGRPGHVFKTTNALGGSAAWTNVTPPVNLPFNAIAIDPTTPNTVFVGADSGVWASNDAGATWSYMGPQTGLPNVQVLDLQIQASTGKVFAFTFGRGAFALTRTSGQAVAARGR